MKKKLLAVLILTGCVIGIGVSAAAASPTGARHAKVSTVTVAMHDPQCHWFLVAGKYEKTLSVSGPVSLLNADEATLKVAGRSGLKLDKVGRKLLLGAGIYHITMVGQAPDDNHLLLTVK